MGIQKLEGSASHSALYNKCKHGAKQRGLTFSLSKEEHQVIIIQNCHYCGAAPVKYNSYLKNKGKDQVRRNRYTTASIDRNWIVVNGIDRVNNSEGYIIQNCLPCCKICNYLKCDATYSEFITWISKAYKHLRLNGII